MLVLGHDAVIDFEIVGADFPPDARFRAQLREVVGSGIVLADLTSEAGTILRLAPSRLRLIVPGTVSALWTMTSVVGDVVRTDVTPPQHLQFQFTAQFNLPVTRGLA